MAKNVRIATDIFRQKWFRELPADLKTLWIYLMVESNIVGVFEVDSEIWNFVCKPKTQYTDSDAFFKLGNRIQKIPNHSDKGIIVGKLDYQNNFGKNSSQWEWVEKYLKDVGLTYDKLQEMRSHEEEQLELALDIPEAKPKPIKEKELRRIIPPQFEWVERYCAERNKGVNAKKFFDYWTAKDWMMGRVKMKDWQAAIRTWEDDGKQVDKPKSAVSVESSLIRKAY